MAPRLRRVVKPSIEIMEALPTVILGFLAGLWLAPLVEQTLPGIVSMLFVVPLGIVFASLLWARLPGRGRHRVPEGWEAILLVPVVVVLGWASITVSPLLEDIFFGGDIRGWLTNTMGDPFDQRNALIVGLAMGFAGIPNIFSIAEDAIFGVPKHLTHGSLALGATPWQTLWRVVLLTASPGIFSALMIGFGRAVGETMIVLMATGNTPVMDWSIFQGLRTLSANIAVEMPESEVNSTHYRVLFLAALVLFMFTFFFNTMAETVRQRLRRKFSSLKSGIAAMKWGRRGNFHNWSSTGTPWVWLSAGAVSISLVMVCGLLSLIATRGLIYFWPHDLAEIQHRENGAEVRLIGELHDREEVAAQRLREAGIELPAHVHTVTRYLMKIGNRDVGGMDFRSIIEPDIVAQHYPQDLVAVERREWGNLYSYQHTVNEDGKIVAEGDAAWGALQERLRRTRLLVGEIRHIEKEAIGGIDYQMERLRLRDRALALQGTDAPQARADLEGVRAVLQQRFEGLQQRLAELNQQVQRDTYTVEVASGEQRDFPVAKVVRIFRPNEMSVLDKTRYYFSKLWEFVSSEPREANTERGIFHAIIGTVMMVIIMSVFVTPFGVVDAVYLREYARQGAFTRLIRIAVTNLAGVPSIVYGVFGLGFFVYFLGGNLDQLFYPEALPSPTFGTPGILWSSLTLAILT